MILSPPPDRGLAYVERASRRRRYLPSPKLAQTRYGKKARVQMAHSVTAPVAPFPPPDWYPFSPPPTRELLLNYFKARKEFSSGVVEGMNNKAKVTMRRSYGFRTFRVLELALYHSLGKLPEPTLTHEFF